MAVISSALDLHLISSDHMWSVDMVLSSEDTIVKYLTYVPDTDSVPPVWHRALSICIVFVFLFPTISTLWLFRFSISGNRKIQAGTTDPSKNNQSESGAGAAVGDTPGGVLYVWSSVYVVWYRTPPV